MRLSFQCFFFTCHYNSEWAVGIAYWYSNSLRAGRSGVRTPVWARFSGPIQTDPEYHRASCTVCVRAFSRGKAAGA
jgi:hypothetical protein